MINYMPHFSSKFYFCLLCFQTGSEPSAPSCDLLDLSPSPRMPVAIQGELSNMNAQLSDLSK
jgi:hypothetical protein